MAKLSFQKSKASRFLLGLGSILIMCAILLVIFPADHDREQAGVLVRVPTQVHHPHSLSGKKIAYLGDSKISPFRNKFSDGVNDIMFETVDNSPIETLLSQNGVPFEAAAVQLIEYARRDDLPMELRLDALDHAFNLDPWQALALSMESSLPSPIAERLLSGIRNLAESPKDQVSACMHLALSEDSEIREQAQELLAFLVSAEEHAEDPVKLREAADGFLQQRDD
jgi:hypothetical protein